MPKSEICKHCHHPAHRADCGVDDCGCVRFEPLVRKVRQRTWIVTVAFYEKYRWTPEVELRVQASTVGGAALKASRQARRERQSRKWVLQTRIAVTPVPRSAATT
jgi:hypothetical protein